MDVSVAEEVSHSILQLTPEAAAAAGDEDSPPSSPPPPPPAASPPADSSSEEEDARINREVAITSPTLKELNTQEMDIEDEEVGLGARHIFRGRHLIIRT